jgi:hypothetical protein
LFSATPTDAALIPVDQDDDVLIVAVADVDEILRA